MPARRADSLEVVRSWVNVTAILSLFENLVRYDTEARTAVEDRGPRGSVRGQGRSNRTFGHRRR